MPCEDMTYIIKTLHLEKACGLRKALTQHRTGVQRYDVGTFVRRSTPLMRTGHLMVIGLVGCIWTGTPHDDLTITTVWEDSKHGGSSQGSLIFQNFHKKVCEAGVVPQSLVLSADNTPKETKNGIVFTAIVWMLSVLSSTRLWRIRTCYKLVGHTHSHCDRAFSRIRAALIGKSYLSEPEMMDLIKQGLKRYSVQSNHLSAQINFEDYRTKLGVDVHNLRNVHDLEVFRTAPELFKVTHLNQPFC